MPDQTLLLGNGFSRAYSDEIFAYDALRNAAGLPPRLDTVFEILGTTDFELVIRRLTEAAELLAPYGVNVDCRQEMRRDISTVRNSLIRALREHHPSGAHELLEDESRKCARFLRPFSRIFTLNYDLLLYWVFVEYLSSKHSDGFGGAPLQWQGPSLLSQTVFYLHGALHLYDTGTEIRKLRYGGGAKLLDQLDANMRDGAFPLFVSEGSSAQKIARIRSNPYLLDAYENLAANDLPLVIYGFNFSSGDRHILKAIERSETPDITVAIYEGEPEEEKDRIMERARLLARRIRLPRNKKVACSFIDAADQTVWR